MHSIKILCNDGEVSVDIEIANCFTKIRESVEFCSYKDGRVLRLDFKAEIMRKIIQWVTYHKDDPPTNEDTDVISRWDADFLEVDKDTLIALIWIAGYLGINKLNKLACKTFTNRFRNTRELPEEFGRILNINNDSTPEEEDKEMEWTEENQRKRNGLWTDGPDESRNKYRKRENYLRFV